MHSDCRAVLMVLPRAVRLKVMSAWKPALVSVPIAVTSVDHCRNAGVQLQLVKFDGLGQEGMRDKQANNLLCLGFQREINKGLC